MLTKIRLLSVSFDQFFVVVGGQKKVNIGFQRGKKIGVLPYLGKEFRILFDMWVEPRGNDVWQSVLHFTNGKRKP